MNQRAQAPANPGRNDRCACGSGKKYKNCCLRAEHPGGPAFTAVPNKGVPDGRLLERALAHLEAGRLEEAQELFRRILRDDPENIDALHYSGLALYQAGETDRAIELMGRAAEQAPKHLPCVLDFGQALEASGALERAISCYRQAAAIDRSSEIAHLRLGLALLKAGKALDAAGVFSEALKINPESSEAVYGLGNVLQTLGRLEQAVTCYKKAIALRKGYIEALNSLGVVLNMVGRNDEAIAAYREALAYKPDTVEVLSNLGFALGSQGQWAEAIVCCNQAIAQQPELAAAILNLANAHKFGGQLSAAVRAYRRALEIDPKCANAWTNLANALYEQDKIAEALESCREACCASPNDTIARTNWLYICSSTCFLPPEEELGLARKWEQHVLTGKQRSEARKRASAASGIFSAKPRLGRKLRLGIVSAELGTHAVAVFLQSFLKNLDHDRFHVTLFPTVRRGDSQAKLFQEMAENFVPLIGIPDEQAAELIRAQKIDILIDTTGHTNNCRLGIFAHRAAPVQCSYIGYWSTTGLTEMDWYVTDEGYSRGCDSHFSERLWRLPHVAHCYTGNEALPNSAWEPDPAGTIWLGSFNRFEKIRRETLRLWAKVLQAMPNANLIMVDHLREETETHQRIWAALADCGIDERRVTFLPPVPGGDFSKYMTLHDRLDIVLDTIPFNSGTTAFDALWMGVPLVALEGERVCGRMAASIVRNLGHPEWAATSEDEYISIVSAVANDIEGRMKLRKTLRASMIASPLCDGKGLARSLEDAFEAMYDRWLSAS